MKDRVLIALGEGFTVAKVEGKDTPFWLWSNLSNDERLRVLKQFCPEYLRDATALPEIFQEYCGTIRGPGAIPKPGDAEVNFYVTTDASYRIVTNGRVFRIKKDTPGHSEFVYERRPGRVHLARQFATKREAADYIKMNFVQALDNWRDA